MASKSVPNKVSDSLVIGTTLLPRRVLSYRWVITDAKVFLDKLGSFNSPTFSVVLPRKMETAGQTQQTSSWFLYAYHNPTHVYISLYQHSTAIPKSGDNSKVVITDCTFSVINSETKEAFHTYTASPCQCDINGTQSSVISTNFSYTGIDKFLNNGTLTIQVNATLLCYTDAILTLKEERKSPQDNVLAGVKGLFANKLFADVTIKSGKEEFKAHKAILASQSPVFKKMLETDMKEQRSSVIDISDTDPKVISDMLSYLYTGSAPNIDTLVKELLMVANKYELSQLLAMCENELKSEININSVVELLLLADTHNASYLKKACLNYLYRNSTEVYRTSQWKQFKGNCDGHAQLLMEIVEFTP